jgi:hypothetical protein
MKTALRKLLRLTRLDTLILGLVEKLALGLVKKLSTLAENARGFLDRIADN